jgi:hypothetical protein
MHELVVPRSIPKTLAIERKILSGRELDLPGYLAKGKPPQADPRKPLPFMA